MHVFKVSERRQEEPLNPSGLDLDRTGTNAQHSTVEPSMRSCQFDKTGRLPRGFMSSGVDSQALTKPETGRLSGSACRADPCLFVSIRGWRAFLVFAFSQQP